ncbi:MAG: Ig-like domain repeat protein [Acidobacteria bacterium]|nr:Ig-like domain repeat protein [Acidobacteriota bacterium]
MLRASFVFALLWSGSAAAQTSDECDPLRAVRVLIQTSAFPSLPGQAVGIKVFVTPVQGAADATGEVHLFDALTDLGTAPLQMSQASFTRTFYVAGAHVLHAYYSGDLNYCARLATFGQDVDHLTTAVTVSAGAAPPAAGVPLTVIAQITPDPPSGVAAPAGPVQFVEGGAVLATAPVAAQKAAATLSGLSPGTHQIVAVLTGDSVYYSVRSAPLTVTIAPVPTVTLLTATADIAGITLTASVKPAGAGSGIPDGGVQFLDSTTNLVLGGAALPPGSGTASFMVPPALIAAAVGHAIIAAYSGSAKFAPSYSGAVAVPAVLSATGAASPAVAPEEIVSLYGANFLSAAVTSTVLPLPTALGGVSVTVTDSAGTARKAGLYLVAPGQINFVIPGGTAPGVATIAVDGALSGVAVVPIKVKVAAVAPGIFTASADGRGVPAAQAVHVRPDGSQTVETVTAAGIRVGSDTVYLVMYGSGIRNRSSLAAVSCVAGGAAVPVSYAGPQPDSPGLDQVNVLLPGSLAGKGDVTLLLTVDGQAANAVSLKLIG